MANQPVLITSNDQIVTRARAAKDRGVYSLGAGGRVPQHPFPWAEGDAAEKCDCSGLAMWACGLDRYEPALVDGQYFDTTGIHQDATGPQRLFHRIDAPVPGCLVVYPDRQVAGTTQQGHVGVVASVDRGGQMATVVHCSHGNMRVGNGKAIQETNPQHGAFLVPDPTKPGSFSINPRAIFAQIRLPNIA